MTIQVAYDNNEESQIRINALMNGSTATTFTITYNSSFATDTFSGFVVGRGRTVERNNMIQGPITIKLSSDPGFVTST